MPVFYDTHAHLSFSDFASDLPEVVERAIAAGIAKIIAIGTDLESSTEVVRVAEKFPNVFAAVGWHPTYVASAPEDVRPGLRELARHPKVVAIGECGLDYHRRHGDTKDEEEFAQYKARQGEIFRQQLELAAECGLNCVIHQRESFDDTVTAMQPFVGRTRGVFHCFSGDVPSLNRVLEMGSLVSFTGIVTFKSGGNAREALAAAPMGKFMFETDCPFLAPTPFRGKRCEPAYVREISLLAAEIKKCSLEELSAATTATAHEFFPKLARAK
jgi:TatD DNase family protein